MIHISPCSRMQLEWSVFEERNGGYSLCVFSEYSELIDELNPKLTKLTRQAWKQCKHNIRSKFFPKLPRQEVEWVHGFIRFYKQAVLIGLNKNIREHFQDELDFCLALDFNFMRTPEGRKHTEIGELEYQAKYTKSQEAVIKLSELFEEAFHWLPSFPNALLCYVPSSTKMSPQIAQKIACELATRLNRPLIHSNINKTLASSKNLSMHERIQKWENILQRGWIKLSSSVAGKTVYIIDDLYQSGISMWSYAKFLKQQGAQHVIGLACVKSWSDTDNDWKN